MTEPTSPTSDRRDRNGGFTLIELTMALAIMALVAALALPRVYPGGGATVTRTAVYSIAAVLRRDRNAAIATGATISTRIDLAGGVVSAGGGGPGATIPTDLQASGELSGGTISFHPDGRSSGGVITLKRGKTAYTVRVDPVTSGVQILTGAL